MYRWLLCGALVCASGCLPSPGPCDLGAAGEIVYQRDGTPAFAGQAVIQTSCGNGGFCHSASDIDLQNRYGAPEGFSFDVSVADTAAGASREESFRLRENIQRILSMRGEVLRQIRDGHMPPPHGEGGDAYRCDITPSTCASGSSEDFFYERIADDGATATPLPTLLDDDPARRDEAQEIVRNWLACRAPAVEHTQGRMVGPMECGDDGNQYCDLFTVPACERSCVDVTWSALYAGVVQTSCTSSSCHDGSNPAGDLDLVTDGAEAARGRLVGVAAAGPGCRVDSAPPAGQPGEPGFDLPRVVPMDAEGSLLYLKLAAGASTEVCGNRMPASGGALSAQRLCAFRAWIDCGACGEGDTSCDTCLEAARAECNADPTSESGCATTAPCDNRYEL